ncbi:outer membrane protein assembly factor BamE [Mesorhizobium sp. B2-5-4]|uniref:Outer membrane protein assembly factor BamE n=1 Tax=Mesorhizobium salmacidum TaxID=3015171 RepID=A0ABU8L0B9_9HYPH|nr:MULTISPECIES: outer membrane protein assembly factor BamE [unclassified Mesorhizobium]TPJ42692.1 outer membrane protein assembly factor BamE [Mesorhizobium sp. B2-6-5]TPJ93667.1 outer membrane protein assembly factor BamE [Mesorhizobium sp. B2-5-13]TPK46849.1 outer membrane protein assembly factor BamE [Mesorhizobium sp. B2-5-4]TPK48419.1 outer membrane protein assembly factor BamE [Mesorhizobium sp. B2-5-5]TPL82080.1 outer membrane protein assembly factor BamE [Mesorhizobium sp. B2-3-13]
MRALNFKSTFTFRPAGAISLLAIVAALSACHTNKMIGDLSPSETFTQGYVLDQQAIDSVPVGSSREQVLLALGTPSTTATFDNEAFYYISQTRKRYVAFDKPRLVDQKVLAVYFGPDSRVTQIAKYGLKDGKIFDFISRTTPTGGKDQNFLSQIINGASKLAPSIPGGTP